MTSRVSPLLRSGTLSPTSSSVVAGWELSRRIRDRRLALGFDAKTVAQRLGFTRNYWSAVENDRTRLADDKFAAMLDLFELDEADRAHFVALRAIAKEPGWWEDYSNFLADDVRRLFGLEAGASHIRSFERSAVNGLLQSTDYARALMDRALDVRPADTRRLAEIRGRRQQQLLGEGNPHRLTAVIAEAALIQSVGRPAVLKRQLAHLGQLIDAHDEAIDVRVQPFSAPLGGLASASTLYLLDFENPDLPTLAWHEGVFVTGLEDDPDRVELLRLFFDQVITGSLDRDESREVIRYYAEAAPG